MKLMYKSAALAAALILTAGISVQAKDMAVTVISTDGSTISTGSVAGRDVANSLYGQTVIANNLVATTGVNTSTLTATGNTQVDGILSVGTGGTIDGVMQSTHIQDGTVATGTVTANQIKTSGSGLNYIGGVSLAGGHIDATMGLIDTVQSDTVTADSVVSKDMTVQNQLNANKAVIVELGAEKVNAGSLTVNGKDVDETLGAHTTAISNLQQQTQANTQAISQESQNRIEADNKLQSQIEVNGYKADAALKVEGNGVLYNHGTDLTIGINLNTSAIEQEEKDRVAADQNLQGQIDTNASNIAQNTAAINQETADRTAADQILQQGIQSNSNAISSLNSRVSDLGGEIDNVGAISAALAGLHPLDYNGTGSKFQLAAAMGDYDGSQAAAIGGFYHFNEDVMMSVGGATAFDGDKKAAFNVGVSFRVGRSSSAKRLNSDDVIAQLEAMNNKIAALEAENQKLTEKVATLQDSEAAQKA